MGGHGNIDGPTSYYRHILLHCVKQQIINHCMALFRVLTDIGLRSAAMWHVRRRQLSWKPVWLELIWLGKVFGVMVQSVHRHDDQRVRFDGATATGHSVGFGGHAAHNGRQRVLPQRFCGQDETN